MYLPQDLSMKIKNILQENNIKAKDMLETCGLGVNTLSNLNHNKAIGFDSLAKIADYLNVSVDYLLGRTEYISNFGNAESVINNGSNNTIQNGNGNTVNSSSPLEDDEMWETYSKLSTKDKLEVKLDIMNRGSK